MCDENPTSKLYGLAINACSEIAGRSNQQHFGWDVFINQD
jgi:hypothetical protein